ncbi:MAG: serine acetyltransferase [Sphingomonadales bacterium]|nr:MAG: serine acetyltransferase [Sphingomonadales bacterium]
MEDPAELRLRAYLDADWARLFEFAQQPAPRRSLFSAFSPRFAPIVLIRLAQRSHANGFRRLAKIFSFLNFLIFGIEVPARLPIGPGLVIPHSIGTILGAGHIGANVTIYQQVTLGAKIADFDYDVGQRPHVEDHALITAGAKIIGPVRIGRGAVIGANAVVLEDVPDNYLAVGVPARITPLAVANKDA